MRDPDNYIQRNPLYVPRYLYKRCSNYKLCSIRETMARAEAAKEAALIEQFLAKCAEDDRKEQLARKARLEERAVSVGKSIIDSVNCRNYI